MLGKNRFSVSWGYLNEILWKTSSLINKLCSWKSTNCVFIESKNLQPGHPLQESTQWRSWQTITFMDSFVCRIRHPTLLCKTSCKWKWKVKNRFSHLAWSVNDLKVNDFSLGTICGENASQRFCEEIFESWTKKKNCRNNFVGAEAIGNHQKF